jgi:hypothetical protein
MSCPYFYPVERRDRGSSPQIAMLPLGGDWVGECRAAPAEPWQPGEATLQPLCNLGYARGVCPRFPPETGDADAVRFTVSRDDAAGVQIYFVLERDHHPLAHGPLEYSAAGAAFVNAPAGETFSRQAAAYVESYLHRKREAGRR